MATYEVETEDGAVYEVETEEPVEGVSFPAPTQSRKDTSLWNEAAGISNRIVDSAGGILDFVEATGRNLSPFQPGGPRLFGLSENYLNKPPVEGAALSDTLKSIPYVYGDEKPNTAPAQFAGELGAYALNAGLGGGLVPALLGGAAAGTTKVAGGSETQQAIAGLAGMLSPLGYMGAKKGLGAISDLFSPAAKAEKAKDLALGYLERTVNVDEAIASLEKAKAADAAVPWIQRQQSTYLPQYQRTAEITQQPGVAAIEEVLRRTDDAVDGVKNSITNQDLLREAARQKLYSKINPTPMLDAEAADIIREGALVNKGATIATVKDSAKKAFIGGEEIPGAATKRIVTGTLNSFTKDGSRQVSQDFRDLVEAFRAQPSKMDLQTLQNYRSAFGEFAKPGPMASPIDNITAKIANTMRQTLDDSIEAAVTNGELPASQRNALIAMRKARAKQGGVFEQGAVGKALRTEPMSQEYVLSEELVPKGLFSTRKAARQTMKALEGQPQSIAAYRSSFLSDIWNKSTDAAGKFNPASLERNVRLTSNVAPEILPPSSRQVLTKVVDDLQSQGTIKDLAFAASKRNSITSESDSAIDLLQQAVREAGSGVVRDTIKGVPIIGRIADSLLNVVSNPARRQLLLNKELAKFSMDPKYALALLKRPTKETLPILEILSKNIARAAAATGATGLATEDSGEEAPDAASLFSSGDKPAGSAIRQMFQPEGATIMEKQPIAFIEQQIDEDPYYKALYEAESGRNPTAKNPTSSAKGGFQFIDATAKSVGLEDPMDLAQSFEAVKKITDQHKAVFGNDPAKLYAAHYLGQTVLTKLLKGQQLTEKQQAQVDYLEKVALPRYMKIYNRDNSGALEA